jgi:hypothetical protein
MDCFWEQLGLELLLGSSVSGKDVDVFWWKAELLMFGILGMADYWIEKGVMGLNGVIGW